jgi:hypothetical protein
MAETVLRTIIDSTGKRRVLIVRRARAAVMDGKLSAGAMSRWSSAGFGRDNIR